jgi:hypothetical protein
VAAVALGSSFSGLAGQCLRKERRFYLTLLKNQSFSKRINLFAKIRRTPQLFVNSICRNGKNLISNQFSNKSVTNQYFSMLQIVNEYRLCLVAGCNMLGGGSFRERPIPLSPAQSYYINRLPKVNTSCGMWPSRSSFYSGEMHAWGIAYAYD